MIATVFLGLAVWAAQAAEIETLIRQLGSPRFGEREAASQRLAAMGEPAQPAIRRAATNTPDAEVRRRALALRKPNEEEVRFERVVGFWMDQKVSLPRPCPKVGEGPFRIQVPIDVETDYRF